MSNSVGQGEAGFEKPTNVISYCQTTLSAGNHKEYLRGNESVYDLAIPSAPLVFVAYSDRVIEGSPKTSISTVPIRGWPAP